MITEIELEGFKSFGSPAETIRLGRLNFLIGANASGKSNLIAAMEFLKNAVTQNVEYAVNELGGNNEVRNKVLRQRKEPKPVRIKIRIDTKLKFSLHDENELQAESFDYEVILDLRSESRPIICSEKLIVPMEQDKKKIRFELMRTESTVEFTDLFSAKKEKRKIPIEKPEHTRLTLSGGGFLAVPCFFLLDQIGHWRFFNISPNIARQSYRETPNIDLGKQGENLSSILHKIEEDKSKKHFNEIINGLKGIVPGFQNYQTKLLDVERKWAFQVVEEKIRGAIPPSSISDGTIRLLALLVIATWMADRSSFIAIEEPENGIHPLLSKHVVELLRTASQKPKAQFLITTHNPDFLDFLEPEEVLLCDKVDGSTRIKRASDVVEIEQFRKHFTLGELWVQGTLGGIP
ncbi:MAG: hypothetical protein C4527_17025 [Candidatus Omnitrophota bacterium]|jgi:predicted ATPase|nr:MAG: hypothetical protein C4527_17025 [Candidatus Omnitrophota bacterium]